MIGNSRAGVSRVKVEDEESVRELIKAFKKKKNRNNKSELIDGQIFNI